ncbi:MAG TPA: hypothetical protein VGI39_11250 [Polyangiaceae bacterium]
MPVSPVSLRRSLALAVLCTVAVAAPEARAQSAADKATARDLGIEGQAALDKKDYATAEDRFRRADALYHAPTLLLGYARAEAGLGRVVNASEAYNRIAREGVAPGAPAPFVAAVEAAKAEVGAVQARIASVTITVKGPESPTVTLDEQPVPVAALGIKRAVDPGAHVVKASADGWQPAETKFTVADAASANASLTLLKAPTSAIVAASPSPAQGGVSASTAPPAADTGTGGTWSTQRTLGIVGIAAGGVGLVVGAVTGIVAIGKHSTLNDECKGGTCPASASGDLDSYHTMGAISTAGLIAGGVLAVAGVTLFFTAPHASTSTAERPHVTPYVGFGSVGAVGTF